MRTDQVILGLDETRTISWPLTDASAGDRGTDRINVTFKGAEDGRVTLYTGGPTGAGAAGPRIVIYVSSDTLMPFPVYHGTLADLTEHRSYGEGVGRWTGRGDGREHTLTYEIDWRMTDGTLDDAAIDLIWEARRTADL